MPTFEAGRDIRVVPNKLEVEGTSKPRPRGTGKLLSSIHGVGLALLRLEHVDMVSKGEAAFEINVDANGTGETSHWGATPWRPSWWPISMEVNTD